MTDTTANLAAALAAFQAEMPTVPKSHTAKVPTKSGGSYSYTYADLADVSEAAMPLLAKHGLSFTCKPRAGERGYELAGVLLHTSGEREEGVLPIGGNSPQEIGSSLTYMRRYLLGCLTGLVTDNDDDGNLAQKAATRKPRAERPTPPAKRRDEASGEEMVTGAQLAKIGAAMKDRGITIREDALQFVADTIGREVESRNELTKAEASRVIDALEKAGAA